MTRDEFEDEIELILDSETGSDNTFHVDALMACYDAQNAENAQLKAALNLVHVIVEHDGADFDGCCASNIAEEATDVGLDGLLNLKVEFAQAKEELARCRQDLKDAAGELVVPMPEPGTDMAKLLSANVILRQREARLREALMKTRRELWHCNEQLKYKGFHEGFDVTVALAESAKALE